MKQEKDYIQDITEIRSMMERSTKFLSLSGGAGVMAGVYALAGAFIAYKIFDFNPDAPKPLISRVALSGDLSKVWILALVVLIMSIVTAIYFSYKNAQKRGEKIWNATAKRLIVTMAVPLTAGGILMLILLSKGFIGFIAPLSLIFYGLALYNAGKFTYKEIKGLGLVQLLLGLISFYFTEYGLLIWALGFGIVHIGYGVFMHYKYER